MTPLEIIRQRLGIEDVPQHSATSAGAAPVTSDGIDGLWQQMQADYLAEMLELSRCGADVRGREEITRAMRENGR